MYLYVVYGVLYLYTAFDYPFGIFRLFFSHFDNKKIKVYTFETSKNNCRQCHAVEHT